jgi:O-methyltransferase involved in polyketide biosynthesis
MGTADLNTDVPHSARIYDYLLGGKDHFEADRQVARRIVASTPSLPVSMRANRRFMTRAARWCAEQGIRQFLDVGAGLPTAPNLHQVVQQVSPDARIVYVDNDPLILGHARALLAGPAAESVQYLDADLRDPDTIMSSPQVRAFDLSRPVAVSVIAVLQHIMDDQQARHILTRLMRPLPSGSALALSIVTVDNDPESGPAAIAGYNRGGVPAVARTRDHAEQLFAGLRLQPPGLVPVHHWHPTEEDRAVADKDVFMYGGVAFTP